MDCVASPDRTVVDVARTPVNSPRSRHELSRLSTRVTSTIFNHEKDGWVIPLSLLVSCMNGSRDAGRPVRAFTKPRREAAMIFLYLTILIIGIALTIRLASWRSQH